MIKKLSIIIAILGSGTLIWFAFAIWVGLYSFYSFPPSKDHPEGSTLLVHREEWEPMFNSPDYVPPKREEKKEGMGWTKSSGRPKKPLHLRTIIKFPYIQWAYEKSLEPQGTE